MSNNFKLDKFIPLDLIDELGIIGIFIEEGNQPGA